MYTVYRQFKWRQVQSCINSITGSASSPFNVRLDDSSDEEDDEDDVLSNSSLSENEASFHELVTATSDSEDDDDDDEREADVFRSDDGYDMETVTRALCVDSCELHRGV